MNVLAILGILSVSLREGGCGGKESSNAAQRHRSGCFRVSRRSRSSIRLGLVSASFNKVCGIEVFGQCQPLLEANTCQGNKWHGIAYGGSQEALLRTTALAPMSSVASTSWIKLSRPYRPSPVKRTS